MIFLGIIRLHTLAGMSDSKEKSGGGSTVVVSSIVCLIAVYFLVPGVFELPGYIIWGPWEAMPPAAHRFYLPLFAPTRFLVRKIPAYGKFLTWEDRLIFPKDPR